MTFTSTHDAAEFINRKHSRFAEHNTSGNSPRTFDTLKRVQSNIRKEPACISATFAAVVNFGGIEPFDTEITLEPVGKDGWIYIERPVH